MPHLFSDVNKLIAAGNEFDRGGFTRAGRSLMKHGYREGDIFPKPIGAPEKVNSAGIEILKKIVSDPNRRVVNIPGRGVEIYSETGLGAYYRSDGTFRGFIVYGK